MLFSITILLILCILLFYIFFYKKNTKNINSSENFVNNEVIPIDQNIIDKYNRFVDFYNPFLKNWEESMITMASLETPQKEATSPSQSPSTSKPSTPTREQLNQTIQSYSQKIGKSLPSITDPLPNNIYSYSLQQLLQIIPSDPIPFQNALTLINERLINSQKDLDKALSGQFAEGFLVIEGYVADQCAELSTCFAQNPQIAEQIANAQIEQEKKQQQQLQNQLSTRLDKFILNNTLQDSFKMNQTLVQKAKEIQNKAQSGELLNMIKIPDLNPIPPYNIPAGGNRLKQMKESDPEKYKEYEKNNSSLFSLKSLFEQINSNLR
jgi:hypothetical protein